ncbi:hypothetical protein P40081_15465 [Paenibacillus sp. FSL P4-0081]|uniref:hypothetical protein n=1 Tax=Paenibacillus sp. FSL P4-0081 TaxID=1536769 RepID=UPI0004F6B4B1|nr:hypothetical protein [Paenibacillus sp. FSL P4-0081]AIQ29390.1 hypothetical protein P40081_15465 [Paenibacillus sp. FSL P4-0081]
MKKSLLTLLFLAFLTACGSSKSGINEDDLAIVKVDNEKEIVKYGMSQEEAEKILGTGKKTTTFSTYSSGISIMYRDGAVVCIFIDEESKGKYKTIQGAEVGMSKKELIDLYGETGAFSLSEIQLDYVYDSTNKKYLTIDEQSSNNDLKSYQVSVRFKMDGGARLISLLDRQSAMLGR